MSTASTPNLSNGPETNGSIRDFGIVIPHLDYSDHLAACLWSILTQEGNTTVHIHLQDGGETDTAERILYSILGSVESSRFQVTYVREPDSNAADAINRGMATVDAEVVTWLGADDFLMPGALQAVWSLRQQHPYIRWVTGVPHIVSVQGVGIPTYGSAGFYRHCTGFAREGLRRGLHAGELNHGWIQQEGTFWEKALWDEVGGLNAELQLAFDFDLWCRLAEHTDLIEAMLPLGAFRKRVGQASSDMVGYLEEANAVASEASRRIGPPENKRLLQPTWVAKIGKKSHQWELIRKEFVLWIPWPSRLRTIPGDFSHVRSEIVRHLRLASAKSLATRLVVVLLGKFRSLFS